MKVTTSDGKTYKVQFVHSSHDLHQTKQLTPGGLRQFVDNLARSLKRRVSFADISLVEQFGTDPSGAPALRYTSVAQGFALCYWKDQFEKKTGRAFALDRALHNAGLSEVSQTEIWDACWPDFLPLARPSDLSR